MGKSIQKSNKHKKLKFVDPFYNGDRKDRMHAGHNLVPSYTEQGLSRSMKDLIRRTQLAKTLNNKSRKKKKKIMQDRMQAQISTEGAEKEMPEEPVFKPKKGEKLEDFNRRVDVETMTAVKESQIEAKMKIEHDPVTDDKEEKPSKKKEKRKQQLQKKKEKMKEKKRDRLDDFHKYKDKVEFGEVVHGPPTLSVRPRHATKQDKPAVQSLLLYKVMNNSNSEETSQTDKSSSSSHQGRPSKGTKGKSLSPSQKAKLDKERRHVINMFRQMKSKSVKSSS